MATTVLPDDLWKRLEPLLPKPRENRHVQFAGRKPTDLRRIVTGILFVLRTGIPWRSLPATSAFPSGQTCRRHLRRWHEQGIWQRFFEALLAELQATHQIDWYRALVDSSSVRAPCGGEQTGPNPTDRRKSGSKHHLLTDAHGIPLATILTGANRHDVTQLLPLIDKIPHVRGKVGAPQHRPKHVQGDRAYDSEPHRQALKKKGVASLLAKRRTDHGSGLGKTRWFIERSLSWLHQFRKLKTRDEKYPSTHEALMLLACSVICYRFLSC